MPATEEYTKEEYDDSTSTIKFQPQLEEALKKLERLITRLNQPDLPQQDLPDDYTDSPYVENFRLKYTTSDEYQNNRALEWGVQFEAKARLHYEAATGNEVRETGLWGSGEHIWLAASPDGLIGTDGMVEIKAPEYCCTALPEHYRVQCQVQAIVLERQWVDFYSYGWRDERAYLDRVPRPSAEEEAALIGALANWWVTYVFHRTEPPRRKPARKQPEPIACPF
jgi:hypothetical protein